MSVPPTKCESQASASNQDAPDDASLVRAKAKDLSLVSLVPKWSGSDTALPIQKFFELIEVSEKIANWSEADQILVCALKLTDAARAFYNVTPELRDPTITWQAFKAHFLKGFEMFVTISVTLLSYTWHVNVKTKRSPSFLIDAAY